MLRPFSCGDYGPAGKTAKILASQQIPEVNTPLFFLSFFFFSGDQSCLKILRSFFFFTVSFSERVRILFWIASTNFVFPVLFSIAQLIVVLRPNVNVADVNDIVLVNTSIAVIGVVFATVWAGTVSWQRGRDNTMYSNNTDEDKTPKDFKLSAPVFALPVHSTTTHGSITFGDVHNHGKSCAEPVGIVSVHSASSADEDSRAY